MIRRSRLAPCAALAAFFAASASAQEAPTVPVMVGAVPDMDACMSLGRVTGLDPAGDNFLAVRAGPGADNAEIDRLAQGHTVNVCEGRDGWLGVVYAPAGEDFFDCEVGSPVDSHQPYAGPCRSGWVFEDYVEMIAG
jgi:hypothetical protein